MGVRKSFLGEEKSVDSAFRDISLCDPFDVPRSSELWRCAWVLHYFQFRQAQLCSRLVLLDLWVIFTNQQLSTKLRNCLWNLKTSCVDYWDLTLINISWLGPWYGLCLWLSRPLTHLFPWFFATYLFCSARCLNNLFCPSQFGKHIFLAFARLDHGLLFRCVAHHCVGFPTSSFICYCTLLHSWCRRLGKPPQYVSWWIVPKQFLVRDTSTS